MDEAHMVGLGKYLDKNGYRDRFDILSAHLKRVCEIAEKYGFRPMIWSDMYFRLATNGSYYLEGKECKIPERVFSNLPEKISLVYWDYYHTEKERYDEMIVAHKKFDREILFCNHARSAICFTPQNATAQSMIEPSVRSCVQHEIKHFFLTMWGDDGGECSRYATLPTLAYTASLAYGNFDMKAIKKLFHTLTGIKFDDFMTVDSMNQLPAPPENGAGLSKALLYNDPLVGIFDITAKERPEIKENAAKALPALSCLSKNKSFGYIFRTQKALAKLLILKADFGVRLRAAYQTGDKETLAALADECKKISALLDKFYTEFHAQWMKENKPFGFDVQDLRLGGLLQRLRACRTLIIEYLSGKRTSIEELEADILPEQVNLNWSWEYICSANSLYKFLAE